MPPVGTPSAAAPPAPDLSLCDREPIHIPGAIQPHGVLLALQGGRLRIVQASASSGALLGRAPRDLLGQDLAAALGSGLEQAVREALVRHRALPDAPAGLVWQPAEPGPPGAPPGNAPTLAGYVHESGPLALLELEPLAGDGPSRAEELASALGAFNWVRGESDLAAKAQATVALLQRLTGFDRVMIYRFDDDWHGEVVAECCTPEMEPYLGLHYPATDIPAQARRLYLVNPTRIIVDRDAPPSPLLPAADPASGLPLDLSYSLLRSVSPVHLEYLRNMGVRATLSAALTREGALWGLVACHHRTPRRLGRGLRDLVGWMVQDLGTQLALAEELRSRREAARLKACRDNVVSAMRRGARLSGLIQGAELVDILGAIRADGVALIRGGEVTTGGAAPDPARIRAIAEDLSARYPNDPSGFFITDCLSGHIPDTADLAPTAAGLAVFPLVRSPLVKLVWFRGEQVRSVSWAGNPDKAADLDPEGRIGPRKSFTAWTERVRHKSLPWTAEEVESAGHLATLVDIELHKTVEDALRASLAEVQRHDAWMVGLHRMNDLLLSCETRAEAQAVIARCAADLFAGYPGALALREDGVPELRLAAAWGGGRGLPEVLVLRDCWALRRGATYEVADPARASICPHVQGQPERPYLCVPLNVRGETLGLLHLESAETARDDPAGTPAAASLAELRGLAQTVGESVKLVLSNLRLQEALRDQAIRDPLTGLFNRRYLDETLPRELHRRERRNEPLVVAMLDLDGFKAFNDSQGHEAGDLALRAIANLVRRSVRGGDIACRYGGEELTLLMPDANRENARVRLDGLRQAIAELRLVSRGRELTPITVSIGIAEAGPGDLDARALLARADAALYLAKAKGRNLVVVAGDA